MIYRKLGKYFTSFKITRTKDDHKNVSQCLTRTKPSIRYAKENDREKRERKKGTRRDIEREGKIREKERKRERVKERVSERERKRER